MQASAGWDCEAYLLYSLLLTAKSEYVNMILVIKFPKGMPNENNFVVHKKYSQLSSLTRHINNYSKNNNKRIIYPSKLKIMYRFC